eukprot:465436_1
MSEQRCAQCLKAGPSFRCGGCKITKYCSKICQSRHWKSTHKKHCKTIRNNQQHNQSATAPIQANKHHGNNTELKQSSASVINASCVVICPKGSLQKCPCFTRLSNSLDVYDKYNAEYHEMIDKLNILEILNDYLHLLHQHDGDEEFEMMTNMLSQCNIKTCVAIRRNYRDRTKEQSKHNSNVNYQILDKIHC